MPAKLNWWYESVIDWMLANPHRTLRDCASEFNVTPTWIYVLTKSQSFRDAIRDRREQHNFMLSTGIIDKTAAVADMALDLLSQRLCETGDTLPVKTLSEVADTALSRLGYGSNSNTGRNPMAQQTQVNVFVDATLLAEARSTLRAKQDSLGLPPRPTELVPSEAPVIDGTLDDTFSLEPLDSPGA